MIANLENSWDFYRKLNFIILNTIILGINIGFSFFEKFNISVFLCLLFLNLSLIFLTLLRKHIIVKNNTITAFHAFFGIKIKTINSFVFNRNSTISSKIFNTSNHYQKAKKHEPTLHVNETVFEIYIDNKHLITLYTLKGYNKLMNFKQLTNNFD